MNANHLLRLLSCLFVEPGLNVLHFTFRLFMKDEKKLI